jgi:methylated-DNA-[protein]-cysteine S-methyltransferase
MIYTTSIETPLGDMIASAENGKLTGLWFATRQQYAPNTSEWTDKPDEPVFVALRAWLADYFAGKNPPVSAIPLDPLASQRTTFRESVWNLLLQIPYGKTTSYGALAKQIAKVRGIPVISARAVGGAVGHNPISILIPCHRVIGADGSITGYGGGIDRKQAMLTLEKGAENW